MVINGINSGVESADRINANMAGSISRDPAVVSVPPQESRPVIISAHVSSVNDIVSFLNSKNGISSDKDLDRLADAFHYLSVSGNIGDIPKIFENTADTKIFAACLRWDQAYPGDGKRIEWALQNTYRGPGDVAGVPLPRERVRGLYQAYEIVKEGSLARMAEDLISVGTEQRHDIVGLYNDITINDLDVYRSHNGYMIRGGILSADGRLAYSYNIGRPYDAVDGSRQTLLAIIDSVVSDGTVLEKQKAYKEEEIDRIKTAIDRAAGGFLPEIMLKTEGQVADLKKKIQ